MTRLQARVDLRWMLISKVALYCASLEIESSPSTTTSFLHSSSTPITQIQLTLLWNNEYVYMMTLRFFN